MKLTHIHRLTALGLAVGMTAALTACGKGKDEAAASTAETAATSDTAATGETADDSAYAYLADFSFSDAFDENGYLKGVTAADYVNLPDDYADITISADLGQVSEDDITNYITTKVLASFAPATQVTAARNTSGRVIVAGASCGACPSCGVRFSRPQKIL